VLHNNSDISKGKYKNRAELSDLLCKTKQLTIVTMARSISHVLFLLLICILLQDHIQALKQASLLFNNSLVFSIETYFKLLVMPQKVLPNTVLFCFVSPILYT